MARLLTYDQVKYLVNMQDAVDSVEKTFEGFGKGTVLNPTKVTLDLGESGGWPPYEGFFNAMPAYIGYQDNAGIKWVGGLLGHRKEAKLPFICGMILLADPKLGIFRAVMDGKYITNLRTGAQTAISLKYLFKDKKSIRIGLFGAGQQGHTQTEAISKVFDIEELRVYDVYRPAAEKFAEEDKKRREEVDIRNGADQMVYQCEKLVSEDGDKFSEDDKKDINDKVDALKEALKGEDINLIKSRQEELTAKFYEISEKVYKVAAEQAQAQQGADGAQPGNDAGYTEANYTDVPEDND